MREIKFRAWDKESKRMSKPFGLAEIYCPHGETINAGYLHFSRESDFIPMQFTGLLDKNGKEIYEGDIVRWTGNFNRKIDELFCNKIGCIKWVKKDDFVSIYCGFAIEFVCNHLGSNGIGLGEANNEKSIEIIGNLYENPELLNDRT